MNESPTLERPRAVDAVQPQVAIHPASESAGRAHALPGEYLSFRLGAEDYGVAILDVKEIRSFEAPTRIADAPDAVLGVVNLRGSIVPIVDLRRVFGCETRDISPLTVVIVLGLGNTTLGVVVDAVSDVVNVAEGQLRPPPRIGSATGSSASAITGLACLPDKEGRPTSGRMVLLLDARAMTDIVRPR